MVRIPTKMQLCFGYSQYMNISARTTEGATISKHHHVNTTHVYAASPAWDTQLGMIFLIYFRIMQFHVFRLYYTDVYLTSPAGVAVPSGVERKELQQFPVVREVCCVMQQFTF